MSIRTLHLEMPQLLKKLQEYQDLPQSDPERAKALAAIYSSQLINNLPTPDEKGYSLVNLKHDLDATTLQVLCGITPAPSFVTLTCEAQTLSYQLTDLLNEVGWYHRKVEDGRWLISSHEDFPTPP